MNTKAAFFQKEILETTVDSLSHLQKQLSLLELFKENRLHERGSYSDTRERMMTEKIKQVEGSISFQKSLMKYFLNINIQFRDDSNL